MSHIRRQSDTSLSPATSSSSHLRPEKRPSEADPHAHDATAKVAKRAQVSRACQRCRNLRRACSDYRPCKRCSDHGLADQCLGMPGPVQITWGPGHIAGAGAAAATSPQAYVLPPAQDSVQRLAHLLPVTVVNYCARRFFARLYPTIPIVTADYIDRLKAAAASSTPSEVAMEAQLVLAAMSALILLQVEEPESLFNEGLISEKNSAYGERLFDEAILAHRNFARKSNPSLELCLLTFLLYACHAALLHHSQAFLFLREANTLWLLLRPSDDAEVRALADRLFWVLLISERSHAVRYRRPVTLQITPETPSPGPDDDPPLVGFWCLAALFRPLDTSFVALLNKEQVASPPSPSALHHVELAVNAALKPTLRLQDTQKANLRVTQLWLRIILWQLRLRFGHLSEDALQAGPSFTFHYPLEVAKDLTLSTRDLPLDSIKVHGVGLTEKLFDIASSVVDVLARIPIAPSSPSGLGIGIGSEDDLNYIRRLITQLPGGPDIYDALLDKHIQQAVPDMELGRVQNLAD
ncbi:hypothetical protein BN1708_010199, partial [Verticillium longisporum]